MNAQNEFEKSLIKASENPSHRAQFYRDIADADFFVIQESEPVGIENGVATSGTKIQLSNMEWNGKEYIPVFSSVARIQQVVQEEVDYVSMNALDLMKMTAGANLLLNPNSDFGKEFPKEEIARIIDGSIWEPEQSFVAKKDTQIMLGEPTNYPHELVDALSSYFRKNKQVKKAYLAHFFNPETDDKPHTLIGVEASGDFQKMISESGIIVSGVDVPDPPVDFIEIQGNEGVGDYFLNESKPFYQRKFLGLF